MVNVHRPAMVLRPQATLNVFLLVIIPVLIFNKIHHRYVMVNVCRAVSVQITLIMMTDQTCVFQPKNAHATIWIRKRMYNPATVSFEPVRIVLAHVVHFNVKIPIVSPQ
jgi:hypothetical protein